MPPPPSPSPATRSTRFNRWLNRKSSSREGLIQLAVAVNLVALVFAVNGYRRYETHKLLSSGQLQATGLRSHRNDPSIFMDRNHIHRIVQNEQGHSRIVTVPRPVYQQQQQQQRDQAAGMDVSVK